MRTTAGILMLGVLAWVAGSSQAADKKTETKVETKVVAKVDAKVDTKVEVKQCAGSCCGTSAAPAAVTVHTTSCPKSCDSCGASVCLGTTMKKAPSRGKFVDWLTYRPLQSSCCSPSIQVLPCRQPPLWTYFAWRCNNCCYAGVVGSEGCDASCGCAASAPAAPACKSCESKSLLKKPLLSKKKDSFATDVAEPVSYKVSDKDSGKVVVTPAK